MLNGNLLTNLVIWTVIVLSVVKSLSNANMLENIGMNFLEPLFFPGFATLPFTLFYSFAFLYHTLNEIWFLSRHCFLENNFFESDSRNYLSNGTCTVFVFAMSLLRQVLLLFKWASRRLWCYLYCSLFNAIVNLPATIKAAFSTGFSICWYCERWRWTNWGWTEEVWGSF